MKQTLHNLSGSPVAAQPLWRNRDFVLASSARFIATAGMGAVIISVMLHLQNLAAAGQTAVAGPWLVAAYLLCSALPLVLLAPWAGRLADTRDSRTLATASSVAGAAPSARPRPTKVGIPQGEDVSASVVEVPAPPSVLEAGRTYVGIVHLPEGRRIELGGIVWSEAEPRALLNDRIVATDGYVEGFTVAKIEENRVALEKDGMTIYLVLKSAR